MQKQVSKLRFWQFICLWFDSKCNGFAEGWTRDPTASIPLIAMISRSIKDVSLIKRIWTIDAAYLPSVET